MKRSKFTDEQILAIVREGEAGRKVADLVRTHGISERTYYRGKARDGAGRDAAAEADSCSRSWRSRRSISTR